MWRRTAFLGPWASLLVVAALSGRSFAQAATRSGDENWSRCSNGFDEPDLAIAACTAIIQSGTKTTEKLAGALTGRAFAYQKKGNYDRAIQDYALLILLTPSDPEAFVKRGEAYQDRAFYFDNKEDYDRAIQDYNQAIRLKPDDIDTLERRAWAYEQKRDYDRAFQDYDQIRIKSRNLLDTFLPAHAYERKGDYDRAIQVYDQLILLHPNSLLAASALMYRAGVDQKKGDYDRAIQDYNQAIHLDPSLARSHPAHNFGRAGENWERCLRSDISADLAIGACTTIIQSGTETNEDLGATFVHRATAYVYKDDYDRAFQDFAQALRLQPNFSSAFFIRALVYEKKGDYDRAIQDWDQDIRLDPGGSTGFMYRARAYRQKGDYTRSLQDYDQAIQLSRRNFIGNSLAFTARGWVRLFMGQFSAASEDFHKALELYPTRGHVINAYLAQSRAGKPAQSDLQKQAAKLNFEKWPGAIVKLYLGSITPDAVLVAANNDNARLNRWQHCEAYFYLGEYDLLHSRRLMAARLFQKAVTTGVEIAKSELPHDDGLCYAGAQAELKRLSSPVHVRSRRIAD